MFTQSCFIRKNTRELIEKLEELGYDYAENGAGAWFIPLSQLCYLGVNLYSKGYYMGVNGAWESIWIDCGTNEQLFLAIAALRDDTDKNQWFVVVGPKGYKWVKSCEDKFTYDAAHHVWHKATVEELIEHFNKED